MTGSILRKPTASIATTRASATPCTCIGDMGCVRITNHDLSTGRKLLVVKDSTATPWVRSSAQALTRYTADFRYFEGDPPTYRTEHGTDVFSPSTKWPSIPSSTRIQSAQCLIEHRIDFHAYLKDPLTGESFYKTFTPSSSGLPSKKRLQTAVFVAIAHHNIAVGLHPFTRLSHCGAEHEREHEHGQHNCRKHERTLGSAALKSRCKALRCTGGRTKNVIRHRFCVGNLAQKALHAGGLTLLLCARAAYRPIHTA